MFIGRVFASIDQKGRLSVPAKFRDSIYSNYSNHLLVLIRNFDQCLDLYPIEVWKKIEEEKINPLPKMQKGVRSFLRVLYSDATTCHLDNQGRILLPQELRNFAGLNGEVVLLGLSNKIEIWNKDKWNETLQEGTDSFPNYIEQMINLGIGF